MPFVIRKIVNHAKDMERNAATEENEKDILGITIDRLKEEIGRLRGTNERLLAALKNWDEEWGEVARHDSYAAPWDRELGQAIEEWRTTATHSGGSDG